MKSKNKKKETFYSVYKKVGNDLKPLAFFKNRQEVEKFLNVKKSFVYKTLKKSKNWCECESDTSQIYFIFKDAL